MNCHTHENYSTSPPTEVMTALCKVLLPLSGQPRVTVGPGCHMRIPRLPRGSWLWTQTSVHALHQSLLFCGLLFPKTAVKVNCFCNWCILNISNLSFLCRSQQLYCCPIINSLMSQHILSFCLPARWQRQEIYRYHIPKTAGIARTSYNAVVALLSPL